MNCSRRTLFSAVGLASSAALLGRYGETGLASSQTASPQPPGPAPWTYSPIDPMLVAKRAYDIYPEGGCMYAVVGSVIGVLADKVGDPFRSFPIEMMRYGDGGLGAWGSLCGVVNGASALIGMFQSQKEKETRESLINEIGVWYETTPLPTYEPEAPQWADEADQSIAESLLCHVSVTRWCEQSGWGAKDIERRERCRRLAADGASKVVELLNCNANEHIISGTLTSQTQSCIDCHGKQDMGNALVKMNCQTCHDCASGHP